MKEYYSIPENVLASFAEQIYVAASEANDHHIALKAEVDQDDLLFTLDFRGFAYYVTDILPGGEFPRYEKSLSNVVPTWCELHAYDEDGEVGTLFSSSYFTDTYLKNIA